MKRFTWVLITLGILLLMGCSPGKAPDTEVAIYHFNDSHSRVEEGRYSGMGFAKMAGYIEAGRDQYENVLVLDAGDTFHGQTIATLVEGASIAQIMNAMDVDVMTAGNHDFNYGQERLLELDEETNFPIMGANVLKDGVPILTPYVIQEVGGLKIAIFGLVSPETSYKTHPNNVIGLEFANPVEIARDLVPQLEEEAHVIIALTHLGLDASSEHTSLLLAESVEGIDLIVDGHSHTELPSGVEVNGTLIVQAGEYQKNLGKVILSVTDGEVSLFSSLISKEDAQDITPSAAVVAIITDITEEMEEITSVVIGETSVGLHGEREEVRRGETNLGNLICDAVLEATGADIVILNGGGIRASIEPGEITLGDVITVLPFGNYVVSKEISGANILAALEHGLDSYPESKGAFPHVAGMTVQFDQGMEPGNRITQVMIAGVPLDPGRTYTLATNDFMAAGGDDYTMLSQSPITGEFDGLDEILVDYIQSRGSIAPAVDGRMGIFQE